MPRSWFQGVGTGTTETGDCRITNSEPRVPGWGSNASCAVVTTMLSNTLNTNEIKNSSGTEVEFNHQEDNGRSRIFFQIGESPSLPHKLTVSHQESGSGMKRRRRSLVRFDKTTISGVDSLTPITTSAYMVLDHPVGASSSNAEAANVIAELLSFCATTGAGTTVLFDGTGNGAAALLNGSL